MGQGQYAVMPTQMVLEHASSDVRQLARVPLHAVCARLPAVAAARGAQIAYWRTRRTPAARNSNAARPRIATGS
jgi:hypothetical protein